MSWKIRYTSSAARAIRRFDPQLQRRIRKAVEILKTDVERGKPLQMSLKGLRSWRTGDYRIVYRADHETIEVLIVAVGHRREVYARLKQLLDS